MGCGLSSASRSRLSVHDKIKIDNIRVVHLDGRVDDYDLPIKVNQVIKHPKHDVMCTRSQLLCPTSSKALKSDCELQLGNLYFLLPISTFANEASVMDMAKMVNRLTNIAISTDKPKESSKPVEAAIGLGYASSKLGYVEIGTKNLERCMWKPVLETIGEKSLDGRSESDLQCQTSTQSWCFESSEMMSRGKNENTHNCSTTYIIA